jgi:hypothetical protein
MCDEDGEHDSLDSLTDPVGVQLREGHAVGTASRNEHMVYGAWEVGDEAHERVRVGGFSSRILRVPPITTTVWPRAAARCGRAW